MPAIQTTYLDNIPVAYAGMIADTEDRSVARISRTVTVADIPFGRAACQGATDRSCRLAADNTGKFVGVTIRDQAVPYVGVGFEDRYAVGREAGLLTLGLIWVITGETVAAGDLVFFVPTTGIFNKTATGNIAVPRARWDSSVTGAGLARLRLMGIV
jgi:hypothetical protein